MRETSESMSVVSTTQKIEHVHSPLAYEKDSCRVVIHVVLRTKAKKSQKRLNFSGQFQGQEHIHHSMNITQQQACRFLLAHQGLWPTRRFKGKNGILEYIRRVGCIQFDPLNIAGHNQELVLQARIPNFRPDMLKELLYQDRALLDGWDKVMSIYSTEDWPYFARRREVAQASHRKHPRSKPVLKVLPQVRRIIEQQGPVSSLDLNLKEIVDWSWTPTSVGRAALESMYSWGELIIHHKVHTRKIYDFAHRHIPEELLSAPEPNTTDEQFHDWYVQRRLGSVGLLWNKAGDAWLEMCRIKTKERQAALERLQKQKTVTSIQVEGLDQPLYLRSRDLECLRTVLDSRRCSSQAAIIAPLDNLLWDRKFVEALFHFRYRWEVYKPAKEREYGYYVLPILYGDRFVARFEPGKDKKHKRLIVKNWWWEPKVKPSERMRHSLRRCFERFLTFLDLEELAIDNDLAKRADLEWLRQ